MGNLGSSAPLPPWLTEGGRSSSARRPIRVRLRGLRGLALLLAGGLAGWLLHTWRHPVPQAAPPPAPIAEATRCPDAVPCAGQSAPAQRSGSERAPHAQARTAAPPLTLHPLPAEGGATDENRREALRAFAQKKASDLRTCLRDPGRGPLRRIGAALEIDSHGAVAAVQILGGDGATRELDSCYSARLRAWRFPQALLQGGDQRLLVNFVL